MKQELRTLEELWDLEDKNPLKDANPAGLMRWMYATGMLPIPPHHRRKMSRRPIAPRRNGGNGAG